MKAVNAYGMPRDERTNSASRSSDPANIPMPRDLSIRLIIILLERLPSLADKVADLDRQVNGVVRRFLYVRHALLRITHEIVKAVKQIIIRIVDYRIKRLRKSGRRNHNTRTFGHVSAPPE